MNIATKATTTIISGSMKSIYKVNVKLVTLFVKSIPSISETLKQMILALTLQLDFHTNPNLVGMYVKNSKHLDYFFEARDTVFQLLTQSVYEFIHIFIATYTSNISCIILKQIYS